MKRILVEVEGDSGVILTNCPEEIEITVFNWQAYERATPKRQAEMLLAVPEEFRAQIIELLPDGEGDEQEDEKEEVQDDEQDDAPEDNESVEVDEVRAQRIALAENYVAGLKAGF